jgi:phenylacetate-CoA ligase
VLRYWTNDLCSIRRDPSPCGRTHARMSFVVGRADDMLVVRGVNVYPSQVEHELLGIDGVSPHFQLVVRRDGTLDTLHIRVERDDDRAVREAIDDVELTTAIVARMRSALGIGVTAMVEPPGSLPRSEGGKLKRTVDERSV